MPTPAEKYSGHSNTCGTFDLELRNSIKLFAADPIVPKEIITSVSYIYMANIIPLSNLTYEFIHVVGENN
jgi:hypothetical protein